MISLWKIEKAKKPALPSVIDSFSPTGRLEHRHDTLSVRGRVRVITVLAATCFYLFTLKPKIWQGMMGLLMAIVLFVVYGISRDSWNGALGILDLVEEGHAMPTDVWTPYLPGPVL